MRNRLAKALIGSSVISTLSALAFLAYLFSSPSELHHQLALGLSSTRLVMAFLLLLAAGVSAWFGYFMWRDSTKAARWIDGHLRPDGWSRTILFFVSAELFLVSLGIFQFGDWLLQVPPVIILRLQPGLGWVMAVSGLAALLVVFLPWLTGDSGPKEEAVGQLPADSGLANDARGRDFVLGCLIILLSISALTLVCAQVWVKVQDHLDPTVVALVLPSVARWIHPEQVERTRYIVSTLLFPILCFFTWMLFGRLQTRVPRSTWAIAAIAFTAAAIVSASWLYYSLKQVDFLYLRILYPDLGWGTAIAPFLLFLLLIYAGRMFSSRPWVRWVLRTVTIVTGALTTVMAFAASLLARADAYVNSIHFNAYFYSVVQVSLGKTLLVDLTSQYGLYPYFLQPVLRVVGLDVPQLTFTMGTLIAWFFFILLVLLVRLARSRLIAVCGILAIAASYILGTGSWHTAALDHGPDPYFQYMPHRVLFPVVMLLLVFIYQNAHGSWKGAVYALLFLACAAGILWNVDTGVIAFGAWVLFLYWETLARWRDLGTKRVAFAIARHTAIGLLSLLLMLGSLVAYTYVRSGRFLNPAEMGQYQALFYQSGFMMIPMPLIHPWNLVILTYMVGLCISAGFLYKRIHGEVSSGNAEEQSWHNMVFLISVLGVGLFTVYQGRSEDQNLLATFWSAFFLLALFADALAGHGFQLIAGPNPRRARIAGYAMLPLAMLILLVLFVHVVPFLNAVPSYIGHLENQVRAISMGEQGAGTAFVKKLQFMQQHFTKGEEVPVFSSKYDTLFYLATKTTNPVQAPGWNELLLRSDAQKYADYLREGKAKSFIVSDEFASQFPDLYGLIQNEYSEVARLDDLAFFERKPGAR